MTLRLAWLGVGHLARYCVPPLVARFGAGAVTLSPRGRLAASDLARDWGLAIAPDNAALVRQAAGIARELGRTPCDAATARRLMTSMTSD